MSAAIPCKIQNRQIEPKAKKNFRESRKFLKVNSMTRPGPFLHAPQTPFEMSKPKFVIDGNRQIMSCCEFREDHRSSKNGTAAPARQR
jgi:hypothetical protein